MENHRLTEHVFQSNALFSLTDKHNWSYGVNQIIQHLKLPKNVFENFVASDILNVNYKAIILLKQYINLN